MYFRPEPGKRKSWWSLYANWFRAIFMEIALWCARNSISIKKYPQYSCKGQLADLCYKEMKKQVSGLAISKISEVARNSFDHIIISGYLGLTEAAKYNNYFYIYNSIWAAMGIVTQAIQASVANSIVADIGTAEGIFALNIIHSVKKVYLFECDPEWIIPLEKTFAPWINKIEIVNLIRDMFWIGMI